MHRRIQAVAALFALNRSLFAVVHRELSGRVTYVLTRVIDNLAQLLLERPRQRNRAPILGILHGVAETAGHV